MTPNVYLEGSIAEAFMHMAIHEGLAEYDYLDDIMKSILERYQRSRMRQRALLSTMLFNKLYLVEYLDSFNLKDLATKGIVSESKPAEISARSGKGKGWQRGDGQQRDEHAM